MDFSGELAATSLTSGRLSVGGTSTSQLETAFDRDWFRISLDAGQSYEFNLYGVGGSAALLDPYLRVYRNGVEIAADDDGGEGTNSRLKLTAEESGTYFVEAAAYFSGTGEYALSAAVTAPPPPPLRGGPVLAALDWGSVLDSSSVSVYFASSGQTFGGVTSKGWTSAEIDGVMAALAEIERMVDLEFTRTFSASNSTFQLSIENGAYYSGFMYPPGELNAGSGSFNRDAPGWNTGSGRILERGSGGFQLVLHEIGHGLGLAHPHDFGGSSEVLRGVLHPGDFGDFGLNQGVFTNMSYNDGNPGAGYAPPSSGRYGYTATLSPLDIAALQERYGATEANTGNTTYTLVSTNGDGTAYEAIWDTGGIDTVAHSGALDALIDLRAATLRYETGGGGRVSSAEGIHGGFTIAHGVDIENARGGGGDDGLNGNGLENRLDGRGGDDILRGFAGADMLLGGSGSDRLIGGAGDDRLDGGTGADILDGGDGIDLADFTSAAARIVLDLANPDANTGEAARDTLISVETFRGSSFDDILRGDDGDDLFHGGDGDDILSGRDGDDRFLGGAGADRMNGGAGFDTADYGDADGRVVLDLSDPSESRGFAAGDSFNGIERLIASAFDDLMRGDDTGNLLAGGAGDDILSGRDGDDVFDGGAGADRMNGGAGSDTVDYGSATRGLRADLLSDAENRGAALGDVFNSIENLGGSGHTDRLWGSDDANTLSGGAGDDFLYGRNGDDLIVGGAGDDRMHGGGGADTFLFAAEFGSDRINGFDPQNDIIAFDAALGLDLASLDFVRAGDDVRIEYGAEDSILLKNTEMSALTGDNFDFDFIV